MQSCNESTAVTAHMGRAIHLPRSSKEHEKWEGPASSGSQASSLWSVQRSLLPGTCSKVQPLRTLSTAVGGHCRALMHH